MSPRTWTLSAYLSSDKTTKQTHTHTHLLDLSEQFSGSAFQTLMETRSGDQINRNFHWQACEVCFPQPFVQRPHRAGFRLRDCSLSMKCNSRNRKLEHTQGGFSIIASHQAPLSFLDVTISCAVQGGAVTAPLWWLRVHQSPQKQQEKLDRLRGDIRQLTRTCC